MARIGHGLVRLWPVIAALSSLLLITTMALVHKPMPPEFAPLTWLIPLALYDLRKREVPGIGFVLVPCGLATLTALLHGGWTLSALTIVVVAVSERRHLPRRWGAIAFILALLICVVLLALTPFEQTPGAIAIIGFWIAYELGWWAGADALAAITLAIMWPNILMLVALAAAHFATGLLIYRGRALRIPHRLSQSQLEQLGVAGMPAIALGAALYILWQWWLS